MGDGVVTRAVGASDQSEAEAGDEAGLDHRLRERLKETSDDPARTWAERAIDALIAAAVGGDLRAWNVLSRRVGTAPSSIEATGPAIDDETARRVLEAVREPVKARSSDQIRT
ncbi:hypothetical protein [Planctomyces sp. SH-PL62]|uniref:hypothetical protein n=1 Tax=Planctomyces sp. SH-PL62 TaxID=1636152 RepID=UPI00078EE61F|nr:hypothetical protein [Planctomyces sp. SH-PL62]AMV37354.1 hypothetical protein VT85_07965 [Planctomyces sp. SH-PL62]